MVGPVLPDRPSVADLLRSLRGGSVTTQIEAARLLGDAGGAAAIEGLIAALHSTELPPLRRAAADGLERIGDPAIPALIAALSHSDQGVQGYTLYVLRQLGAVAIPSLITAFTNPDRTIRRNAAVALKGIAGRGLPVVPALIEALRDESSNVRVYAAFVLSDLVDLRAVEPLIDALHDAHRETSLFVAAALSRTLAARDDLLDDVRFVAFDRARKHFDDPGTVPWLLNTLKDANDWERLIAAIALGHANDLRAVDPLLTLLCDDTAIIRCGAAAALGNLGDPRAIDSLLAAFDDPDVDLWVRCSAVYALGKIDDPRCVDLLDHAARRADHWRIRERAVQALGQCGDRRALPTLQWALCEDDPAIRESATGALVRFGDAAVPELAGALRDANACVRQSAAKALARIGTGDALAALEMWHMKRRR